MICTDSFCRAENWLVQRSAEHPELWGIAASAYERPFSVAGSKPVCPYCGTTLATAYTLEQDEQFVIWGTLQPALAFSSAAQ
jgi:hypothetical protein